MMGIVNVRGAMQVLSGILVAHPDLALFLTLAIGYAVGKIGYRSFTLGSVSGCLIAGVLIGQTGVEISNDVKQAFFCSFFRHRLPHRPAILPQP